MAGASVMAPVAAASHKHSPGRRKHWTAEKLLLGSVVAYSLVRTCTACVAVLCAAVLRHHIVVWAVIAPKLVFEMCFVVVSDVCLLLALLMAV